MTLGTGYNKYYSQQFPSVTSGYYGSGYNYDWDKSVTYDVRTSTGIYDDKPWKTPEQLVAESRASALTVEKSAYGEVLPMVRGAITLPCRTIWRSNVRKVIERLTSGKGGEKEVTETFHFEVDIALAVCDNPFNKPQGREIKWLRLYADDIPIIDRTSGKPKLINTVTGFKWYDGTHTNIDPTIEAAEGVGSTPRFKNTAYMVLDSFQLKSFADRIPIFKIEIADVSSLNTGEYTLTSGDAYYYAVDLQCNYLYNISSTNWIDNFSIKKTSLEAEVDFAPVQITGLPANVDGLFDVIGIPCQPYILASIYTTSYYHYNAIINCNTGSIISLLEDIKIGSFGNYQNRVLWFDCQLYNPSTEQYIAVGQLDENFVGPWECTGNAIAIMLFDLSGYMHYVAYGDIGPAQPVVLPQYVHIGETGYGFAKVFWTWEKEIYLAKVAGGVATWELFFDANDANLYSYPIGIKWDSSDDTLVTVMFKPPEGDPGGTKSRYVVKIDANEASLTYKQIVAEFRHVINEVEDNDSLMVCYGPYDLNRAYVESYPGWVFIQNFTDNKIELMDTFTGQFYVVTGNSPAFDARFYSQKLGLWYYHDGANWKRVGMDQWTPGWVDLWEILQDFAILAGADPSGITFNPSDLGALQVRGFIIREDVRWRDVIAQICELYEISWTEDVNGWHFRMGPKDGAFVVDGTIEADDLIQNSGEVFSTLKATRLHELDIPVQLDVHYIDYADQQYTKSTATAKRPISSFPVTTSKRRETIEIPIIISAKQAQRRAREALYRYVAAQSKIEFSVPPKYLWIEPGDVIDVPDGTFIRSTKVKRVVNNADFTSKIEGEDYLSEVETAATAAGESIGEGAGEGSGPNHGQSIQYPPEPNPFVSDSQYYHLDIPLIRSIDEESGTGIVQYFTIAPTFRTTDVNWRGANLYRSTDNITYTKIDSNFVSNPVVAVLAQGLGGLNSFINEPKTKWTTDTKRTIYIQVISGDPAEFESCTWAELNNGANVFAFGQPGRWEICQFKDVEIVSSTAFRLTNCRRGLRGTENYMNLHEAQDYIILLNQVYTQKTVHPTGDLDSNFYYKAVGSKLNIDNVVAKYRNISGAAEMCYAPVHIDANWSGLNLIIDWIPRTRLDGRWTASGGPYPIGEAVESYEVDIMDGTTVLRTLSSSTRTVTYTESQIIMDWGTPPFDLDVRVYQLNAVRGRGHEAAVTLDIM